MQKSIQIGKHTVIFGDGRIPCCSCWWDNSIFGSLVFCPHIHLLADKIHRREIEP